MSQDSVMTRRSALLPLINIYMGATRLVEIRALEYQLSKIIISDFLISVNLLF